MNDQKQRLITGHLLMAGALEATIRQMQIRAEAHRNRAEELASS